MTREEIENSNKGKLEDFNDHSNLLVSFGGIQQGIGIPVFEFFNSISDFYCDKIFLRDDEQSWYQKGVDTDLNSFDKVVDYLQATISNNKYKKICFLGNSMGGYAAILFGSILNVDDVISFAPQSYIDRWNRILSIDTRWRSQISKVYRYERKKKEYFDIKKYLSSSSSYKTKINIYYSLDHRLDRRHAERLKKQRNIILHPISEGGHSVVKVIKNSGGLKSLIKATFEV